VLKPPSLQASVDQQLSKRLPDHSETPKNWRCGLALWVMTSQQQARMLVKTFPAGMKLPLGHRTG